jgi:hypothetical protein
MYGAHKCIYGHQCEYHHMYEYAHVWLEVSVLAFRELEARGSHSATVMLKSLFGRGGGCDARLTSILVRYACDDVYCRPPQLDGSVVPEASRGSIAIPRTTRSHARCWIRARQCISIRKSFFSKSALFGHSCGRPAVLPLVRLARLVAFFEVSGRLNKASIL